jgi:hypothetical protein
MVASIHLTPGVLPESMATGVTLCLSEPLPKSRQATTCSGSRIPPQTKKELLAAVREMEAELAAKSASGRGVLPEAAQDRAIDAAEACFSTLARLAFYATSPGTYRCREISRSEKLVEFQAGTRNKSLCLTIATQRPQPKS